MNEQLIKFIELCLADGVITDKEKSVILKKAQQLGVDQEECEVILDSMLQRIKQESQNKNAEQIKTEFKNTPKLEIDLKKFAHVEGKEYKLKITIDDDRAIYVHFEFGDEVMWSLIPNVNKLNNGEIIPNFKRWDDFIDNVEPHDQVFQEIINVYGRNSQLRQKLEYSNGDEYDGQVYGNKRCGIGEFKVLYENAGWIFGLNPCAFVLLRGKFEDDVFINGEIDVYKDKFSFSTFYDAELYKQDTKNSIFYFKGQGIDEKYKGCYIDFKKTGKGILIDEDENEIHGEWKNDILISTEKLVNKLQQEFEKKTYDLAKEEKWGDLISHIEAYIRKNGDILKKVDLAEQYLRALYKNNGTEEKAFNICEAILRNVDDKSSLYNIVGSIFLSIGKRRKDIGILTKASKYFSLDFNFEKVNEIQIEINKITEDSKRIKEIKNQNQLIGENKIGPIIINDVQITGPKAVERFYDKRFDGYRESSSRITLSIKNISVIEKEFGKLHLKAQGSKEFIFADYSNNRKDLELLIELINKAISNLR